MMGIGGGIAIVVAAFAVIFLTLYRPWQST
jgi:hypothetical protein